MARRRKDKPEPEQNPESQALLVTRKNDWIDAPEYETLHSLKWGGVRQRMRLFERHFEQCGGNVTIAAQRTGVSRRAYYRWMAGTQPAHRQFQKRIMRIRPADVILDKAERVIDVELSDGNLTAAMFTINKLGHARGWQEQPRAILQQTSADQTAAVQAVRAYQLWLNDNPSATEDEKSEWIARFARAGGIETKELIRTMRVQEVTQEVQ